MNLNPPSNLQGENVRQFYYQKRKTKKKKEKKEQETKLNFWDKICFNCCIINKRKKSFLNSATKVIDYKLSVEYLLELSNEFQVMKEVFLEEEIADKNRKFFFFSLNDLLEEIKIKYSNN